MSNVAFSETAREVDRREDKAVKVMSVSQANPNVRELCWSGHSAEDWEILIYKTNELFEACFFRWPIHHEHVIGTSFESVRHRAESRIRVLEARRFKGTKGW